MPFQKLVFKPGIMKDNTSYSSEGGWSECNLVRFRYGYPQSMGGWQKFSNDTFLGTCRSLLGWSTLAGQYYIGVGTSNKFYVENSGLYYDITPIRRTVSGLTAWSGSQPTGGPFSATNGSKILNVYDPSHGGLIGDYVTFSGATGLGGTVTATVLNTEFQITGVTNTDLYQVTLATAANGSDTGHGVSANASYEINTGLNTTVYAAGWGAGTWGRGGWNTPVTLTSANTLRLWSQDTWGEDLMFNARNGNIYYWQSSLGTSSHAVALSTLATDTTCPTLATQVLVSDRDRHLVAFGPNNGGSTAQDAMFIRWCNREDYSSWTKGTDSDAGNLRLGTGSQIIKAVETKREILVFTDLAIYSMQFIGPPYTFGAQQVSSNITTIGYNGFAVVEDVVYWMGINKFYIYTGAADELPCTMKEWIFTNFNMSQADKVYAAVNSEYNEITWFYPSANATENDSYATYNYAEKLWTYGSLARTAWLDRGVNDFPIASGTDGYLYNHEVGNDDGSVTPNAALNSYILSAPFDIGEGDNFSFVKRILPDVTFVDSTGSPQVTMVLEAQNFPGSNYSSSTSSNVSQTATVPIEQFTEQAFVRLRGRQISFKIQSNTVGTRWILGNTRIEIQPDGRR